MTSPTTDTITLMSHPGQRAHTGYGPTQHAPVDPATMTKLVTIAYPDRGEDVELTYVLIDDDLWVSKPLTRVLDDVVVDGDTILFDGCLPDDGSCHGPVFRVDRDRFYQRAFFHGEVPFLVPVTEYGSYGSRVDTVMVKYADPRASQFVSFVSGQKERAYPPVPLPDKRVVHTVFEQDKVADLLTTAGITITIHDEAAARERFDPFRVLAKALPTVLDDVRKFTTALTDMVTTVEQIKDGAVPDRYLPPHHSGDRRSRFTVDGSCVDTLIRYRALLELFAAPDGADR